MAGLGAVVAFLVLLGSLSAQTPVILPNLINTIAGITPVATTVSAACPTNAQFTATDTVGDGCPAVNATFGGNERSMTVDPEGNVYVINDTANPQSVRRIDARTGNISVFAGFGSSASTCSATTGTTVEGTVYIETDKVGDNCPVALSGGFNGARGMGVTPYGNLILTVTGDNALHFICTAVSPLCTAAQVKVNLMRNIAGCTTAPASYGTAVSGTTAGTAGDGTLATQFSGTCTVGTSSPRQAASDRWENVYIADNSNNRIRVILGVPSITVNSSSLPNPLYAALATSTGSGLNYSTPVQGYIYPIAGGATACAGKTDAGGDGCPFYQTVVATSSTVQGLAVDNDGDFIFADGLGRLRTIYMGGTAIKSALAAVGISSPQIGYSYALIGNGSGSGGVTGGTNLYYNTATIPYLLGSAASLQSGSIQRLAIDSVGNIYIGDQAQVLFYDIYTGYVHRFGGATTATSCNASAIGDGCPVTQSLFGAANSVLSLNFDNIGNLYIQDLTHKLIRRVSASLLPTSAVNSSLNSLIVVHAPVGASSIAVSAASGSDFTIGSSTCPGSTSVDGSNECSATATYAPTRLAQRSDPISVATTVSGNTTTINTTLAASSTGSALVFDSANAPSTNSLGAATTGNSIVVLDGFGNEYVSGTQGISKISGSTVTNISATPATYIAVDPQGNVYAANASATSIAKYAYSAATNNYTLSTITIPTLSINGTLTQAMSGPLVVDPAGVIYLLDLTNKQVVKFLQGTTIGAQLTQTALVSPVAMTQDNYGQLIVVDGVAVYKIPPNGFTIGTSSPVANTSVAVAFSPALTVPTAVAADQGGTIYVADNGNIVAHSLSNFTYTIPHLAGSGVAVDGVGNLYVTNPAVAGVTQVLRNAEAYNFGTDIVTAYVGVLGNAGAFSSTGFNQSDTGGNYTAAAPGTALASGAPACSLSTTALAGGAICNVSLTFSPSTTGSGDTPDLITLLPSANTLGSLSLDGTKNGTNATSSTAISGNTSGLVYSTGTETTFTVTVTQSIGTPSGVVSVQIDGNAAVNYPLTATSQGAVTSTATVPVSGLIATGHTIVAAFANQPGIVGSTSSVTSFSIGQAPTVTSWTPGATTQQYSAAIGTAVLNATANTPGSFIYTATPSGGSAQFIHSASYLPIGTYSLGVTFIPTDAVDYSSSTGSVASYTVTRATTTAPIGTTQFLVAADSTGNYSTVQAAVNALPSGGSVYIKPGSYPGFITVVQPNIALRGLGGDPTKVILTHEAGAFGSSYPYTGEFQSTGVSGSTSNGGSNGWQLPTGSSIFNGDEGSATLVAAKGTNLAVGSASTIPNGLYVENLSLINGYDTDTSTTTNTYETSANGTCTINQNPAMTYSALYNAQTLCASQALVVWITADLTVMNNVYTTSLQDTIYAASQGSGSNGYVPSRQYWFRGKVSGDVDFIFGDAAAVFDNTSIYTEWHGNTAGGTETIHAQNKAVQTGSSNDYLSGYVMNSDVFTSQSTGMTSLYFGRPYGAYSTWAMLNSYIDQVNPLAYIPFGSTPPTPLTNATYVEYNDIPYADPTTGSPDLNGISYLGTGGNSGSGVTGTREASSTNPGTPMANNGIPTALMQAQAQAFFPTNFLSQSVPGAVSSTKNWNPTAALAANVNAFVPSGTSASVAAGSSVTILMRPQTPGLGAITNGTYTIPTGSYTLTDSFNGGASYTLASGTLDASGEAYYTSITLPAGTHNLTWTYSGDSNFAGSTTASAYVLTVTGSAAVGTTTTVGATINPIAYGQTASITTTVSPASGSVTPTGSVNLTIDGTTTLSAILSNGTASFTVPGLSAGSHILSATYTGATAFGPSSTSPSGNLSLTVNQAALTVTASCSNRIFGQVNVCSALVSGGYQFSDSAATVFTSNPTGTTTAARNSPAGGYTATPVYTATSFGSTSYTITPANSSFTISGGAAQSIIFAPLPNFAHGASYQLTARATSGLPVSYSVTGDATVSGSTLTVTGTGLVTVQASQSIDPTGDYAPATPVSRSFTAQ